MKGAPEKNELGGIIRLMPNPFEYFKKFLNIYYLDDRQDSR